MDEARFGRISELRQCWVPAGERPIVPKQVVRESVYAYALTRSRKAPEAKDLGQTSHAEVCMETFIYLTHNLLVLLEDTLREVGIEWTRDKRRIQKRLEQTRKDRHIQ